MDKIRKFFFKLNKKERTLFGKIFFDIHKLDIKHYDVKPLGGIKSVFRLRKGNIRIIFMKSQNKGIILDIGFRKDVYKKGKT